MDNKKAELTADEIFKIMYGVKRLHRFYKSHPQIYFALGRQNGKTNRAIQFIKEYDAIILAFEKAEKRSSKTNRLSQFIFNLKQRADNLRSRFKLWLKPHKNCKHCCVACRYYHYCYSEIGTNQNTHKGGVING